MVDQEFESLVSEEASSEDSSSSGLTANAAANASSSESGCNDRRLSFSEDVASDFLSAGLSFLRLGNLLPPDTPLTWGSLSRIISTVRKQDIEEMRKRLHEDLERDLSMIRQAYQIKLNALNVFEHLDLPPSGPFTGGLDTTPQANRKPYTPKQTAGLTDAILGVLPGLPGEFNINHVRNALAEKYPYVREHTSTPSLSATLKRLAEEGTRGFAIKERGTGGRASIYIKEDS